MPKEEEDIFSNLAPGYEGVAEFYDLFADNSDIPFYLRYARRTGPPILDLAGGTGRVAFVLAQAGFDVTILDNSPSMLAVARKRLDKISNDITRRITLIEGNMASFEIPQKFALIIIPNSFGHALTPDDQLATLHCIKSHLRDDGFFILDLFVGEQQYTHALFEDAPVPIENNQTVERHGEITSDSNRKLMHLDLRYVIKNGDGSIVETIEVTSGAALLFKEDVDSLLQLSGFGIAEEFGGFNEESYTEESGRRILILKKRKEKSSKGD
ncbi:MAG: class I SAM-dependent methyltransferase [Candidatus Thorarchaeota archaeon]